MLKYHPLPKGKDQQHYFAHVLFCFVLNFVFGCPSAITLNFTDNELKVDVVVAVSHNILQYGVTLCMAVFRGSSKMTTVVISPVKRIFV